MFSFKKLKDILEVTVEWEKQMRDLYDVAELGLKTKESKKLLYFLKESQHKHLEILQNINVKKYGPDEWIKFAPDFGTLRQIPQHQITRNSSADDIFNKVRSYENSLESFYKEVSEHAVSESQTELFASLAIMKGNQLSAIKNFMDSNINPNLG